MGDNISIGLDRRYIEKIIDSAIDIFKRIIENKPHKSLRTNLQLLIDATYSADGIIETLFEILNDNVSEKKIVAEFQVNYSKGDFSDAEKQLFLDTIRTYLKNVINDSAEMEKSEPSPFVSDEEGKKIVKNFVDEKVELLRIEIDGTWYVTDMMLFCQTLERLTTKLTVLILTAEYKIHPSYFKYQYRDYLRPEIQIKKIQYASPGVFDVFGIGKVFEELNNLFQKIIFWKRNLRLQKLDLADKEIGSLVNIWEKIEKLELNKTQKSEIKQSLEIEVRQVLKFFDRNKITGSAILLDEKNENDVIF
jgi:hypothetical protein